MYIPHQDRQAIHQDVVNDGLRRSERRRLLTGMIRQSDTEAATNHQRVVARLLMGMLHLVARPS